MVQETYTFADIEKHKSKNSLWFVVHGKVYDVTKFIDEHPGGEEVMLENGGIDATEAFEDIGHSEDARLMLKDYYLGELALSEAKKEAPKRDYSKTDKPSGSYSGKDNLSRSQWMYVLVPLALVVAFVAYRYM